MPPQLWELQYNSKTGFYEISENGILYQMNLEETRLLRDYFRHFNTGGGVKLATVSHWYKDSNNDTKKLVIRSGMIPKSKPDFYPDPEYLD